jgi:hypothetical protein
MEETQRLNLHNIFIFMFSLSLQEHGGTIKRSCRDVKMSVSYLVMYILN